MKDAILNIMLAGRDTVSQISSQCNNSIIVTFQTACVMSFAVYMLATHPTFLIRLRQEILEQVGTTRRPNYEDIHKMKYLRAVLNGKGLSILQYETLYETLPQKPSDYTHPCE